MTAQPADIHHVGSVAQRSDVTRAYTIDVSKRGTPTSPSCTLFAHSDFSTNLSANLSGSPSVSGDNITTALVTGLTKGTWYRLDTSFTVSGNTEVAILDIWCDDSENLNTA